MNKDEYINTLNQYCAEASQYVEDLNIDNELNYDYYFRELMGNERPGESSAIASDCFDVVESDMPSLVRTFLGGGDIMEFKPKNRKDPKDLLEAKQKTRYINDLVLSSENSFTTIFDWLKGAEIANFSVLTYYPKEEEKVEHIVKENLSGLERDIFLQSFEDDENVISVEIESEDDDNDVELRIKRKTLAYVMEWIPEESFLITKDGTTMRGHVSEVTKGDLIAMYPDKKNKIKDLSQQFKSNNNDISNTKQRQISLTDTETTVTPVWYSEIVTVKTMSVRIDKDGDGYAERRRIIMCQDLILEDEPFDNLNYAIISAYPIPGKPIGKSRVAVTRETQKKKTFLERGILNNMAMVNKPVVAVNTDADGKVNIDDLLNRRTNSVVRVKGQPALNIQQFETPYIGTQALQIIQYLDFNRAQSTGALMASQGLNKDDLYNETATRFNGVQDEGAAKLEMIMRIYAETGFKHLYQGFEWMVRNYQNPLLEINVLGEEIVYDPNSWRYEHQCKATVGLAASDTEELTQNLGVILNLLQQLKAGGSTIVDESKIYNVLEKILHNMGMYDTASFINNPEIPQETAQAQLEQLKVLVAQLQEQVNQNPFAEAENIKAQARLIEAQAKDQTDRDRVNAQMRQFMLKLAQEDQHFRTKLEAEIAKNRGDFAINVTDLEIKANTDYRGGLDEQRS